MLLFDVICNQIITFDIFVHIISVRKEIKITIMKARKVILCIQIPTIQEVGKHGLSFSDSMGLLENFALLQRKLAGVWEINVQGEGNRMPENSYWSDAGEVLQVTLTNTLNIGELRIHYQHIESNDPNTLTRQACAILDLEGYPKGHPAKLIIGAKEVEGKFVPTYTFQ